MFRYGPCVTRDHTVLPATHTRTISAFTPQPQDVTALWLLLIVPTHEEMARLSLPACWLHTEIYVPYCELNPDMVTHSSTNRAQCRLTLWIKTNALPGHQTTIFITDVNACHAVRIISHGAVIMAVMGSHI